MSHGVVRCSRCAVVIVQCRCIDHEEELRLEVCADCKLATGMTPNVPGEVVELRRLLALKDSQLAECRRVMREVASVLVTALDDMNYHHRLDRVDLTRIAEEQVLILRDVSDRCAIGAAP